MKSVVEWLYVGFVCFGSPDGFFADFEGLAEGNLWVGAVEVDWADGEVALGGSEGQCLVFPLFDLQNLHREDWAGDLSEDEQWLVEGAWVEKEIFLIVPDVDQPIL